MSDSTEPQLPPIATLTKKQRRVLGTLIEKALTVPDSYPLTLNSLVSGCNQKSNRAPLASYDETDVEDTVNELRDLGLVAAVHTESGRTERYRHYFRRRFTMSEPQVGILTELMLRGRQAVGELRTRAGRLAPKGTLETQEQLRVELQGLLDLKLIQASGPLDRRGIEVDHNLYEPHESQTLAYHEEADAGPDDSVRSSIAPVVRAATGSAGGDARVAQLESDCAQMRREQAALTDAVEQMRRELEELAATVERLRRDLGA
ncbi:MAG: DUF480 domain-containing protein [Planctomycetaceae bacterium]|nr:MAG: DUF480 domain-containing protein [Planctomycetaceae bacterium]